MTSPTPIQKKKGKSGSKQTVRINVQYYKHIKADERENTRYCAEG